MARGSIAMELSPVLNPYSVVNSTNGRQTVKRLLITDYGLVARREAQADFAEGGWLIAPNLASSNEFQDSQEQAYESAAMVRGREERGEFQARRLLQSIHDHVHIHLHGRFIDDNLVGLESQGFAHEASERADQVPKLHGAKGLLPGVRTVQGFNRKTRHTAELALGLRFQERRGIFDFLVFQSLPHQLLAGIIGFFPQLIRSRQ